MAMRRTASAATPAATDDTAGQGRVAPGVAERRPRRLT
jgi:hypothetical protein